MLGAEVFLALNKSGLAFIGTDREVDITDPAAVRDFTGRQAAAGNPLKWIINCAAYTAVDKAENDAENCVRLNVIGPGIIADAAQNTGARVIHISTDYVFDGTGMRPYNEDDAANPIGIYGKTKREGELAVLEKCPCCYIVRTAWLYGKYGANFVHTMIHLMNKRDEIMVVHDQRGSPTWAYDAAQIIVYLLVTVNRGETVSPGIYHYTNEGDISWFDFAREIYRQGRELGSVAGECVIKPCSTAEYPVRAKRPAHAVLDKTKIKTALGVTIPAWNTSLNRYLTAQCAG
jgi:dTDP-4-dehydrorhamnose reductase